MILKNKTALITGASGVIGKTIAEFFAKEGCNLILASRSGGHFGETKIHKVDVADLESIKNLMKIAEHDFGKLDILVTAAGIYGEIGTIEASDPVKWMDAVKVNLLGTMLSVKYALPLLKKSGKGKIIVFAGGGDGPLPNFTSYASSKGAVLRFVESASKELSPYGIDINAVSPGLVNSGFVQDMIKAGPGRAGEDKYKEALEQVSGEAETASPEKAAGLAVFLASGKSDGLTGKNISAVWDKWAQFPTHIEEIKQTDIYNWRRIKPKDRGYDW
jgi:NAD(P)-dependent dehydrogenase (short-subunit alcohol dehydrogenase family)